MSFKNIAVSKVFFESNEVIAPFLSKSVFDWVELSLAVFTFFRELGIKMRSAAPSIQGGYHLSISWILMGLDTNSIPFRIKNSIKKLSKLMNIFKSASQRVTTYLTEER